MQFAEPLARHEDLDRVGFHLLLRCDSRGSAAPGKDPLHLLVLDPEVDRITGERQRIAHDARRPVRPDPFDPLLARPEIDHRAREREGAFTASRDRRSPEQAREPGPLIHRRRVRGRAHVGSFDHDLATQPDQRIVLRDHDVGREIDRVGLGLGTGDRLARRRAVGRGHAHERTTGRSPVRRLPKPRLGAKVLELRAGEARAGVGLASHVAGREQPLVVRVVDHPVGLHVHPRLRIAHAVDQDQFAAVRVVLGAVSEEPVALPFAGRVDAAADVGVPRASGRGEDLHGGGVSATRDAREDEHARLSFLCQEETRREGEQDEHAGGETAHDQPPGNLKVPPRPLLTFSTSTAFKLGSARNPTPVIRFSPGSVSTNAESEVT